MNKKEKEKIRQRVKLGVMIADYDHQVYRAKTTSDKILLRGKLMNQIFELIDNIINSKDKNDGK